jgi:hypothetical protein
MVWSMAWPVRSAAAQVRWAGGGGGVIGRHAGKGALINRALGRAREGHAPMLELINGLRRVAAQIFDRVLVSEPVGALDGVVHVPFPVVRPHIAERGGDAALGRDRMRTGREDLGHAGDVQPRLGAADDSAQPGAAGADDHHVESVVDDRIGTSADRYG